MIIVGCAAAFVIGISGLKLWQKVVLIVLVALAVSTIEGVQL